MCNCVEEFWKEIVSVSKTWSIRRQMLVCYIMVMLLILFLIIFLVLLNLFILGEEIVAKVEETLGDQASDSMNSLIKEGGALLYSSLTEISIMASFIREMLINMHKDEDSFALEFLESLKYEDLPPNCLTTEEIYGDSPICKNHSSYITLSDSYDSELLKKVSRFDNLFSVILSLTSTSAIRYMVYFEQANFTIVFPGSKLPGDYDPPAQIWYQTFISSGEVSIGTNVYTDNLGNGTNIISIVEPLYDSNSTRIGVLVADLSVQLISEELSIINYLNSGKLALVHKNGDIFKADRPGWWSNSYTSMATLSDNKFWTEVVAKPEGIHFMINENKIYRVAVYPVSDKGLAVSDDWWYMLILFVEEKVIMQYREDSRNKIDSTGTMLTLITVATSGVIIAIIVVLIYFLAKSIREPLQGIIDFTDKINANATEKDVIAVRELDSLKEGEDQIAKLVQAYKSLAGSLINRKEEKIPQALQIPQDRVFLPNELYEADLLNLDDLINQLSDL